MHDLEGWLPVGLSEGTVDWIHLGDCRLVHPFFADSVREARRLAPLARQTPVESLLDVDAIPPTGFLFHMSRCGSTLIAQMLASSDRNVVISEAPPLDAAIQTGDVDVVRAMIHAMGQRRGGREHRYFIKFDCWHTLQLPLLREAFPNVPWAFLYRDPAAVIRSQAREPSMWSAVVADRLEYVATRIRNFAEAALAHAPDGLLVDYAELPETVFTRLTRHFRCTWEPDELAALQEASQRNAKSPWEPFAARKHDDDPHIAQLAAPLKPTWQNLAAARGRQIASPAPG